MRIIPWMILGLGLSLGHGSYAVEVTKFAQLEVMIEDAKLLTQNAGIRTLFVILYDADSKDPKPRPYGALKVDLTADAKGTFYKGELTSANIQVMGAGELPKNLKIKARLDKDGSAGPDQSGDLVGITDKVKVGSKAKITIATVI